MNRKGISAILGIAVFAAIIVTFILKNGGDDRNENLFAQGAPHPAPFPSSPGSAPHYESCFHSGDGPTGAVTGPAPYGGGVLALRSDVPLTGNTPITSFSASMNAYAPANIGSGSAQTPHPFMANGTFTFGRHSGTYKIFYDTAVAFPTRNPEGGQSGTGYFLIEFFCSSPFATGVFVPFSNQPANNDDYAGTVGVTSTTGSTKGTNGWRISIPYSSRTFTGRADWVQ